MHSWLWRLTDAASIVTRDICPLFTVMRTDLTTYDRVYLTYPPSSYLVAIKRAASYQRTFDPKRERYDYRVVTIDLCRLSPAMWLLSFI